MSFQTVFTDPSLGVHTVPDLPQQVRVQRPRILQVSTQDIAGGAESVAWHLFQAYGARGFPSWLAVGRKVLADPDVLLVPNDQCRKRWTRVWLAVGHRLSPLVGKVRGAGRVQEWVHWHVGQPRRLFNIRLGHEDFSFPGTWRLLDLPPQRPDIIHCHNLHGGYFDLRALPWLSHQVPVILTLHDAWLLSGHCAHSLDCERWKTGCGHCPDLTLPPATPRDATAYNWQRKRAIYAQCKVYVATPSRWLMRKVEESRLASAVVEARVIPNGVDVTVFHPADKREVRRGLGIPQSAKILLFVANGIQGNPWKDYRTLQTAVARVAERLQGQDVLFIALGEAAPTERIGRATIRFVPYQHTPTSVAHYFQAADLYVHAARAETFPTTVLEALACGTPVVATAVGGIPEQVKSLADGAICVRHPTFDLEEATGMLVPPGDAEEMARGIEMLLTQADVRLRLAANAARDSRQRFDLDRQVDEYLAWYDKIIQRDQTGGSG